MNKILKITSLILVLGTTACALPDMKLQQGFAINADEYKVEGRNGWSSKKPLEFGPFIGSDVKRGWTSTYNIPLVVRFQGSKHKLGFSMKDHQGRRSSTYAKGKIKSSDLRFLDGMLRAELNYESNFAGVISLGENENYNFVLPMPFETTWEPSDAGVLDAGDKRFSIHKIQQLEGQRKSRYNDVSGYELRLDGNPVAAVQKINSDKIWLSRNLSDHDRFLLANLCASLILMKDLEQEIYEIELAEQ